MVRSAVVLVTLLLVCAASAQMFLEYCPAGWPRPWCPKNMGYHCCPGAGCCYVLPRRDLGESSSWTKGT